MNMYVAIQHGDYTRRWVWKRAFLGATGYMVTHRWELYKRLDNDNAAKCCTHIHKYFLENKI